MTKVIAVSSCCVPETDLILLEFLLSVLEKQTERHWRLSDDMSGEIVLVNLDDNHAMKHLGKDQSEDKVLIMLSEDSSQLTHQYSIAKPMRSADFISVVKNILKDHPDLGHEASDDELAPAIPAINAANKETSATNAAHPNINIPDLPPVSRPAYRRLHNILTQDADCFNKPVEVIYREVSIIIDFQENIFYCEHKLMLLSMLCKANIENIEVKEIERAQLPVLTADIPRRALSELIWCSVLLGSSGELLENINEKDVFHLKRWPDLKTLVHLPRHITLTAFLSKHHATLAQVSAHTRISPLNIIDFINACHIMGYLDTSGKADEMTASTEGKKARKGLFSKLRDKLGIKEAG